LVALGVIAVAIVLGFVLLSKPFPSDHTPEGAYLRVAKAIDDGDPRAAFAYLETDAQWACFTIRDARKKALDRARASYPESERVPIEAAYRAEAEMADGSDVFAELATHKGFVARLRRDLSGVARVEIDGPRASVVTVRGARYPFRVRDNGIWGLTIFTAELMAESERANRDLAVVSAAADDYDRARAHSKNEASSDAGATPPPAP
jgi:hypothetical protein